MLTMEKIISALDVYNEIEDKAYDLIKLYSDLNGIKNLHLNDGVDHRDRGMGIAWTYPDGDYYDTLFFPLEWLIMDLDDGELKDQMKDHFLEYNRKKDQEEKEKQDKKDAKQEVKDRKKYEELKERFE